MVWVGLHIHMHHLQPLMLEAFVGVYQVSAIVKFSCEMAPFRATLENLTGKYRLGRFYRNRRF